jgi:hypothetical protein
MTQLPDPSHLIRPFQPASFAACGGCLMNPPKSAASSCASPNNAPLPLWMIFPVIFAALYLTHWSLLRLPYYWDEAGYYIPAAWDFFRTGSLIPITTSATPIRRCHPSTWPCGGASAAFIPRSPARPF